MARGLVDHLGRPIDTSALRREQAAPTLVGVRSPYGDHPAAGLTPPRLARLLRDAVTGEPERYLELAEDMEERDLHYAGVLAIRKRQVAGLDITVDAASDAAGDVGAANLVREVIDRDAFEDELIDVLDAVGKGVSATEIIWDTSESQWRPARLEWRDPRWFRFDARDMRTLLVRDITGDQPLKPYGWIVHQGRVKSGIPIRSGIARVAAWSFMFKAFTVRDWAVFSEAYGMPIRLGKYGKGATEADKDKLARAVASIASDYSAIIPVETLIEFVKADLGDSTDLYERRADWLDRQVSKVVLGQTQTTDATAGGYATASVHDGVRADIERSDARQLAATLNRDLVRPLIDLNMGPQRAYPKIRIGRAEQVDVNALIDNIVKLVPLGLRVGMSTVRDRLGLPDPEEGEALLGEPSPPPPADANGDPAASLSSPALPARTIPQRSGLPADRDAIDLAVSDILSGDGWEQALAPIADDLEARLAAVTTADELRAALVDAINNLPAAALAEQIARAGFAARLAGEAGEDLTGG